MSIFFGDHEFIEPPELGNVQQVFLGTRLIWPPGGINTNYRLTQAECKRVIQGDTTINGDYRITQAGITTNISAGVQAVLDRMCALAPGESDAISDFYTCMQSFGLWDKVRNIWAPGMSFINHRTAWIDDRVALDPAQTGELVVSLPNAPIWQNDGTGRTLFPVNTYWRTSNTMDQMFDKQVTGMFQMVSGWATGDGDYQHDIYGGQDVSGGRYYNRWRGNGLNDYDLVFGTDGPSPRPVLTATSEDKRWGDAPGIIGGWSDRTNDYVLSVGNEVRSATRNFTAFPTVSLQFTGANIQGSTQNNTAWMHLALVVLVCADTFDALDAENLRGCMLQFCRDIGTANVPAT